MPCGPGEALRACAERAECGRRWAGAWGQAPGGKAVGKSGPQERTDRAGVRESWAARAGPLAVGVWAGFQAGLGFLVLGFLFLSISISFTTNSN